MSLSLLSQNACNFSGCGLNFQNLYELVAHIEFAHIPLIEEEQRQKVNAGGDEARLTAAPNLPLSFFQRVFPTPYRPTPCTVQPVKLSFNHYRKRALTGPAMTPNIGQTPNYLATPKREDESDSNLGPEDTDECTPSDPEIRFGCTVTGCGKRYKNNTALRLHLRSVHGIVPEVEAAQAQPIPITPEGANVPVPGGQSPSVGSPTKYAASRPHKCTQCTKRYKTPQGLQNHVSQSHQKLNGTPGSDNSPSPAVLAQMIMQKSQQAQGGGMHSNERSPQNQPPHQQYQPQHQTPHRPHAPLPVSMTNHGANQGYHGGERSPMNSQAQQHMPVRSVAVQQQNRMASQGHPPMTTGQMLQQQLMQQKRAQAQQFAQQQAQQSPQHHHHQQQQMQQQMQRTPSMQNGPEQHQQQGLMHHQQMQQQHNQQQNHPQMEMRRYAQQQQQQPVNGQMGAGVESFVPPVVEQVTH